MAGLDICLDVSCILFIRILVFKIVLVMVRVCIELSIYTILGKEVCGREGGGKFFFLHLSQREVNGITLDL